MQTYQRHFMKMLDSKAVRVTILNKCRHWGKLWLGAFYERHPTVVYCSVCKRPLYGTKSRADGIGPVCSKHRRKDTHTIDMWDDSAPTSTEV